MDIKDPVGLAIASIAAGAATGAAVITAGVIAARTFVDSASTAASPFQVIVPVSLAIGVAAATATGAMLARPFEPWRRGVIGMLSLFGTALLTLFSIPLDMLARRPAVIAYLALLVTAAVVMRRTANRARE